MMIELDETPGCAIASGMAKWQHYLPSTISHHGQACCDVAREWMIGTDFSQLNSGHPLTGPRWLRQKFKWGPSKWPIHWCEAVREETLDCGALGALSHALFVARGVRSFPAQFILEFNDTSSRHWVESWEAAGGTPHWINEGLIYHEGCAVALRENEIKLWDATATWWINPKQFGGYGGVLAVRIFDTAGDTPESFAWGAHRLAANEWHKVDRAKSDFALAASARKKRSPRSALNKERKLPQPAVAR